MKLFAILLLTALSASISFAAAPRPYLLYNITCVSESENGKNITQVSLKNLLNEEVKEGEKYPFQLTIETLNSKTGAVVGKALVYRGLLETEDVLLKFVSTNKEVKYSMYLDEWEGSTLRFKGQKEIEVNCNPDRE